MGESRSCSRGPAVFQSFFRQDLATRRHADAVTRLVRRANPSTHRAPSPPASGERWGNQNSDQRTCLHPRGVKSRDSSSARWRYQSSTGSWAKASASRKPSASPQIASSATNVSSRGASESAWLCPFGARTNPLSPCGARVACHSPQRRKVFSITSACGEPRKGTKKRGQAHLSPDYSFFGRPRGRSVDSRPSVTAARFTQSSLP